MRLVISAFLLALSICVFGLAATTRPLFAQEACTTINDYAESAAKYDADIDIRDGAFLEAYHAALGFDMPSESSAKQMFFIVGPLGVLVGLVEPDGCVNFAAVIPVQSHTDALAAVERDA